MTNNNTTVHLCECGCGQPTRVPRKTNVARGQTRGVPMRFVHGHNARKPDTEYGTVMVGGKQCFIHRLRAERALGKHLPPNAVVHHADGSGRADAPLVICQDENYHRLLHVRMRVKAIGGNPNTDARCTTCKRAKPFSEFGPGRGRRYGLDAACKECVRERYNRRRNRNAAA